MALSMFGEYFHNVDAKGRLSVPAKFRDILGSVVVISIDPDGCLRIYSSEKWDEVITRMAETIPTSTPKGRKLFRYFTSKASTCELDSQGRIIIPPSLRQHAGITKEVVVVGSGEKAEVWDKKRYEEMFADMEEDSVVSDLIEEYGLNF
ncbi:MraZ protein [Lachnospiraceae bacterium NE2001]|nr:MraZ protein [Lachnospiraceae bacterium NE2001]